MTTRIAIGQPITNFQFKATNNVTNEIINLHGNIVLLYFYPKDNTPGCTSESKDFRDLYEKFKQAGTEVFGISRDSIESHERFKAKHSLPFELISDQEEHICKLFQVIKPKVLFGKSIFGLVRSTFVIDREGKLAKEWRKVSVKGHAQEVLDFVNLLKEKRLS